MKNNLLDPLPSTSILAECMQVLEICNRYLSYVGTPPYMNESHECAVHALDMIKSYIFEAVKVIESCSHDLNSIK
jgi:hypothetical protein